MTEQKKLSKLTTRILTAVIFVAITVAAIIYGKWTFVLFMALLITIGVKEFTGMLKKKGINVASWIVYLSNLNLLAFVYFDQTELILPAFVLFSILAFVQYVFSKKEFQLIDMASTFMLMIYTGLMPLHFLLLRNLEPLECIFSPIKWLHPGAGYLLVTILSIVMVDTCAYFAGKNLGKTKLCPHISPKKTVEGAIGGALGGIVTAVALSPLTCLTVLQALILGIIIAVISQLGDLVESLIKRNIGVKDSGDIVPGHGGILDRADSYILTAPLAFYYINWFVITGIV